MNTFQTPVQNKDNYHEVKYIDPTGEHRNNIRSAVAGGTLGALLLSASMVSNCGADYRSSRTGDIVIIEEITHRSMIDEHGNRGCTVYMRKEVSESMQRLLRGLYSLFTGHEQNAEKSWKEKMNEPHPIYTSDR